MVVKDAAENGGAHRWRAFPLAGYLERYWLLAAPMPGPAPFAESREGIPYTNSE
jgi:hypothetical protein